MPSHPETGPSGAFTLGETMFAEHVSDVVRKRLAGATRLVEMTRRLAVETDIQRILHVVTAEACPALDCERASLFLLDAERQELFTRVATELEIDEIRIPVHQGITGWVARERRTALIPDVSLDERWSGRIDRKTGFQTRSMLAVPMLAPDGAGLLGVLQVLNKQSGVFDAFDEHLLQAFAAHAAAALERSQLFHSVQQARELELSLEAARNVQRAFLPQELPEIPGYSIAAWWRPAQGVGGDYYDVVPLPDGRLALAVADVSGHGLGPSLIMAAARAMLHVVTQTHSRPGRILSLIAQTITPDLQHGRFITFLLGALDPRRHELTFANAGHGPSFHYRRATGQFRTLQPTGFPVGVLDDRVKEYPQPLVMEPGDLLVLATDGAIEQRNAARELLGLPRFQQWIHDHRHLPATELVAVLEREIMSFSGREHPEDDITLLILERAAERAL